MAFAHVCDLCGAVLTKANYAGQNEDGRLFCTADHAELKRRNEAWMRDKIRENQRARCGCYVPGPGTSEAP